MTGQLEKHRISAKIVQTLDGYKLNHPVGEVLVLFTAGYSEDVGTPDIVNQKEDVTATCMLVLRSGLSSDYLQPFEYVDILKDILSGLEIDCNRSDCLVRPGPWKLVKEDNTEWWFQCDYKVPNTFLKIPSE